MFFYRQLIFRLKSHHYFTTCGLLLKYWTVRLSSLIQKLIFCVYFFLPYWILPIVWKQSGWLCNLLDVFKVSNTQNFILIVDIILVKGQLIITKSWVRFPKHAECAHLWEKLLFFVCSSVFFLLYTS